MDIAGFDSNAACFETDSPSNQEVAQETDVTSTHPAHMDNPCFLIRRASYLDPCMFHRPFSIRAAFAMGILAAKKDDLNLAEALHLEAVLVLDRLPEVRVDWLVVQEREGEEGGAVMKLHDVWQSLESHSKIFVFFSD